MERRAREIRLASSRLRNTCETEFFMRIVAVADTHGDHDDLGVLAEGDVLIHAGDAVWNGDLTEFRRFAEWFRSRPHTHKIFVAGNHDRCFAYQPDEAIALLGPDVHYLLDQEVTIDGLVFWGSPWQPVDDGVFLLPRGPAMAKKWERIPEEADVLITHVPPRGFGDRANATREGCEELVKAVWRVKPTLHVFGHVHYDGGAWHNGGVCFSNVTTWESCRSATTFEYDVLSKTVAPIEVPPRHVL
jgi:predicted phosphohydrolase